MAEALLAAAAVTGTLWALGAPPISAALAGAVAMATSPVITIVVQHELRAPRAGHRAAAADGRPEQQQLAALALKVWRVVAVADDPGLDWQPALANAVVVLGGSFLLGTAAGLVLAPPGRHHAQRRTTRRCCNWRC